MQLTVNQIRRFLDEVRTLPAGARGSDLGRVLGDRADDTRRLIKEQFGIDIVMDKVGVETLDGLLNAIHEVMKPTSMEETSEAESSDLNLVCESLGVLFGEILRTTSGGKWVIAEVRGRRYAALELEHGAKIAAMQKVGKQFLCGKSESILFMFGFVTKTAEAARRIANMTPEERAVHKAKVKEEIERRKREKEARG